MTARIRKIDLYRDSPKVTHCPRCGELGYRHSKGVRKLKEVGITRPVILIVTYAKYCCDRCLKYFSQRMDHLALPGCRFTNRVRRIAVDMVIRDGLTLGKAYLRMRLKYYVRVPESTLHDWIIAELVLL